MTRAEAEIFIRTVIDPGDVFDLGEVLKKHRELTLAEALQEYLGDVADFVGITDAENNEKCL